VITSVLDETSKTFIDYQAKFGAWLDKDEKTLYWMSERSGYNHIYALDPQKSSEQALKPVTSGAWNVKSITGYQPDSNEMDAAIVGFHKNQDPYYVHYARIDLKAGKVAMLTESDGTHRIQVSPNRKYIVDTWSRVDKAPVTELRDANSGKLIMPLEVADTSRREALGIPTIERFVAPGRDGKTLIYGNVIRPIGWSREKKYPVIEQVYAGPQDHYVAKAWSDHMGYMQKLADKGFIVVQLDGMGTNWRGKAFHDVCYKNLRDGGFPDRVAWIKALAAKDSSVDTSRVGVYGGSAGGQNAVAALIWHGDFYKAAVADCGCHDNRMDKTWWNELWMGYPVDDSYRLSSNVEFAHQITGDLMLVVGEIDHNVDPASTMQVVDALIKADKDFDLLVIPGSDHGAAESPYGRRRRTDFFVNKLIGKPVKL
jgi:dipeptidyl aminopeptidase/acylaminoacyl peptidase